MGPGSEALVRESGAKPPETEGLLAFHRPVFSSLAVLDPRVSHTVDVFSPFISGSDRETNRRSGRTGGTGTM